MHNLQLHKLNGQWAPGNPLRFQPADARTERAASAGGQARADRLTPERRSEIARMGRRALIEKRFKGDQAKADEWLAATGRWAYDRPYREMGMGVFPPPPPLPEVE